MLNLPCVIFAGGKSSRMGEDKSLLPFGSFSTLSQFQLNNLSQVFENVYISCKSRSKFNFEAKFIEDALLSSTFAPTIGFLSVFEALNCERFFAISVDTPFISKDIILKLIDKDTFHSNNVDATIAKTNNGMQPMCGIYHISLKEHFLKMANEDNHKLGYLLRNSNTNFVDFDDERAFLNINYPQEYQEALQLLQI